MSPEKLRQNPEGELRLRGRVLYLTEDPRLIRQQLEGENLTNVPLAALATNISTDAIIPARYCLSFEDDYLAEHCLTGFGKGVINPGEIRNGGFDLIVAGPSFGSGSSREHAPIAIKAAGIRYVAGFPVETIFRKNSENLGLVCIDYQDILETFLTGESVSLESLITNSDEISAAIVRNGGLLQFLDKKAKGEIVIAPIETEPRPMNAVEKIILRHLKNASAYETAAVKPGDVGFVSTDLRYGYEIMTPISEKVAKEAFGAEFPIVEPDNILFFEDHTVILGQRKGQTEEQWEQQSRFVGKLIASQRRFANERGLKLYDPRVGICHNVIAKEKAMPGQVIVGTDSHTCSQGALGSFAFGIGATEMAGAWIGNEVRVEVPKAWKFLFTGKLNEHIYGKDVMLYIHSGYGIPQGEAVGRAFVYQGRGLESMDFDDQFVLANMIAEGGAVAGFVEPNEVTIRYLMEKRNLTREEVERYIVRSDDSAVFEKTFHIDLSTVPEMVARPGSPRSGVPVAELNGQEIDVVYVGSCTGGNMKDVEVFLGALGGERVKIPTYLQLNALSERIEAEKKGYIKLLEEAGVTVLDSGCGDCCNLGFGIAEEGQSVASNTNRNYENRMGPADVYLVDSKRAGLIARVGKISA